MKKIAALTLLTLSTTALVHADPTVSVFASLAPNLFGSPSGPGYVANATHALENGLSSYGTVGDPTYYSQQTSPVTRSSVIVTGFNSWLGNASPVAPYQNEYGNRMHFGIDIKGNGTQFSISQLSFSATSTGDSNGLGFGFNEGDYDYSNDYIGIIYNPDSSRTYVTSGLNTQLVDELVGRGSGNSYDAYVDPANILSNQQMLDAAANDPAAQWDTFTGTYDLDLGNDGKFLGSASFTAVPEPSTVAALGLGAIALICKRRRKSA